MGNCVAPIKPKGLTEHNYPSRYLSNKNTLGRIFDWCITILPLIELYWQMNKPRGAWKTLSDSDFLGGIGNSRAFGATACLLRNPILILCGVCWTKFECILTKILMMSANRTRGARGGLKLHCTLRLRGDANQCASDTLADSRVQKPKNFLAFFSRLLPQPQYERIYWVFVLN